MDVSVAEAVAELTVAVVEVAEAATVAATEVAFVGVAAFLAEAVEAGEATIQFSASSSSVLLFNVRPPHPPQPGNPPIADFVVGLVDDVEKIVDISVLIPKYLVPIRVQQLKQ